MSTEQTNLTCNPAAAVVGMGEQAVRELSLCELAHVSGGSPNGTWAIPVNLPTLSLQSPVTLPNGTW